MPPRNTRLNHYRRLGHQHIVGVDEAGRGSWAGPLVVGMVVANSQRWPAWLNDSKLVPAPLRQRLANTIRDNWIWSVGVATVTEINDYGLTKAQQLAADRAWDLLPAPPTVALCDHCHWKSLAPTEMMIKGDQREAVIAAASIIAKTYRDYVMRCLHDLDPRYNFDRHKGYGTAHHQTMLKQHGVSIWHRCHYAPIRDLL